MKNIITIGLALAMSCLAHSQDVFVRVTDGAYFRSSAQIIVLGEFENQGYVSNDNRMTVGENFFDQGTYTGFGWLVLDGPAYAEVEMLNPIYKLSVDKPSSAIESHADIQCTFSFELDNGEVNLNGNSLIVGNELSPGQVTGGDQTSFVRNGDMTVHFHSNTNVRFPMGTDIGSPVQVIVGNTDTLAHWITMSPVSNSHPDMPTSSDYLAYHWEVEHSPWTDFNCDIELQYDETHLVGDESLLGLELKSAANWIGPTGSGADLEQGSLNFDPGLNTFTWLGINDIGDLAIFNRASACPGDFNNDQMVNTSDLLLLLGGFSCTSMCVTDMDGDGLVNTSDLLLLLGEFGSSCL